MTSVRSFHDLPQLLNHHKEPTMGYPRKKTPQMLDRVVQILWHFKHLHGESETPSTTLIGNELGITPSGVGPYINKLEEAGRVDRIQMRPMRVTLLDHPMNRRAIKLYQRELEKAHKPLDVKPPKPVESAPDNRPPAPVTIVPLSEEAQEALAKELAKPAAIEPPRATKPQTWADAEALVRNYGGDLEAIASHYILKTAKSGALLEELLERGYTIYKTNPSWR